MSDETKHSTSIAGYPMDEGLSRRQVLAAGAALVAPAAASPRRPLRVAAITTVYTHNSHADVILSRLLQGENLDFRDPRPNLQLVGLCVDQFPASDLSREFARRYGFRLCATPEDALTLGTGRLAVDGILVIGEHGQYPQNEKGQDLYPRKRFFDAAIGVMRRSGRAVPIFVDKHLSHSWDEAKAMVRAARAIGAPLMAGSSVPGAWRRPAIEVPAGAPLREIVGVSYHTLYGYGFHGLEMLQCLAERRAVGGEAIRGDASLSGEVDLPDGARPPGGAVRRAGGELLSERRAGETGVRRVQCLEGAAVWEAGRQGRYDRALLDAALARVPGFDPRGVERLTRNPTLFLIEYRDGFKASLFTLNPAVGAWAAAWRTEGRPQPDSTLFWTQEARPLGHFTFLVRGIDSFVHTGRAPRPLARTLLTTGLMDFLLTSRLRGGAPLDTPELAIQYRPGPAWRDPGPPPPARPLDRQ
ncbi:MAG TPA: hypothetical protein VKT77_03335 [Chthonomonadaceae bacterium]|nr:hypothetical protein [Chthonomonadaceae bacterium]